MPKLIVMRPEGEHEVFELTDDSATLGRAPENSVPIDDVRCSRRQCQILRIASGFELVDLKSRNGTKVNGIKRDRHVLCDGDIIEIGKVRVTFRDREGEEEEVVLEDFGRESEIPMGGECFLVYADGDKKGDKIILSEDRTTFGRKDSNKICLRDPMASSYHCEITREGGGYVLRDLGSTNGSMVDGEAVSEIALNNGARIRIGRTGFIFVDPAVADFEQALAADEESETDWGLMRAQVDMARVRRARRASLVWGFLIVVVLASIPAVYVLKPEVFKSILGVEESIVVTDVPGNLIPDASFEERRLDWWIPDGEPGEARVTKGVAHQGELVLQLLGPEEGMESAVVLCPEEISVAGSRSYEVSAWVKSEVSGTAASAGVLWSLPNQERVKLYSLTPWARGSGWTQVRAVVTPPEGVNRCRVILLTAGPGSARFDDVVFREVKEKPRASTSFKSGNFRVTVSEDGALGVERTGVFVLWNGGLVGLSEEGELTSHDLCFRADRLIPTDAGAEIQGSLRVPRAGEVPATITLTREEDRVRVKYELTGDTAGLAAIGLGFELARDYVQEGATLSGERGARPMVGETDEQGVRKVILGGRGRRMSLMALEPSRLKVFAGTGLRAALLAPAAEKVREFEIVTDFKRDRQEARQVLDEALAAKNLGRLGEAIGKFDRVVNEFPFDDTIRGQARKEREDLITRGRDRLNGASETYGAARDFFDEGDIKKALVAAERIAADYKDHELAAEATNLVGTIQGDLEKLRGSRHEGVAGRLKLQADDFRARSQFRLAEALYRDIASRFPRTSAAREAEKALSEIEGK